MPLPTSGPDPRARSGAETPEPLSDAEVTLAQPSTPPPLPLIRRKATAAAALGLPVPTGSPVSGTAPWPAPSGSSPPATAPWPMPPLAADDPNAVSAAAMLEAEADAGADDKLWPTQRRWWSKLKAPSRPVWLGALVATLAAGIGWTAGAKPWAHQRTAHAVRAVKANTTPRTTRPALLRAHAPQAAAHLNRRVASKAKSPAKAIVPAKASAKAPLAATKKAKPLASAISKTKAAGTATKPAKAATTATKAIARTAKAPATK